MIDEFKGKYSFLSNFYLCSFWYNGDQWRSSEHAFQAAKAKIPLDYFKIRDAKTPGLAKRIARQCLIIDNWDQKKIDIMREVLVSKFSQNENLKQMLLNTGNQQLIEGNTWGDIFWGVSLKTGKGQNILGLLLMSVRSRLK